ncbi:MAG: hypothetical protein AAEJ04_03180 [Planctomycetota bacterium]
MLRLVRFSILVVVIFAPLYISSCVPKSGSEFVHYCLLTENPEEAIRTVSLASGEVYHLKPFSFGNRDLQFSKQPEAGTDEVWLQFRYIDSADGFVEENQGRQLAVVLPEINQVIIGKIKSVTPDGLSFFRKKLTDVEKKALGGWGLGPSGQSTIEYSLVQEEPTENTRTIQDLAGESVHIEPASYTAKNQISGGYHGFAENLLLYTSDFLKSEDAGVTSMEGFLKQNNGRTMAVVNGDVVVMKFRVRLHDPGSMILEGISQAEFDLWKNELR